MNLQFLGGVGEVGRSAILVNDVLLLDFGMAPGNPPQFPVGDPDPEAVVVSHGHLDHVGAIPTLYSGDERPPVHWTAPTRDLAQVLARDTLKLHGGTYRCPFGQTELKRMGAASVTHGYDESFEAAGHEVTFHNAGHIPGSAHVLVDDGDTRLLYTSDFHTGASQGSISRTETDRAGTGRSGVAAPDQANRRDAAIRGQRLVEETTDRPDADAVICESTYADVTHEDRQAVERRFAESVKTTVWEGGTVVVPAFAIGRTQEALMICEAHDIDCFVDGMGIRVTDLVRRYPAFVRDPDALQRATSNARRITGRDGQRRRIAARNNVIVTTSGMLTGGPAMTYVPAIRDRPVNKITFTGYQVDGTPGRELLDTGRAEIDGRVMPVAAQVESYDLSAHADREGLLEFLDSYRDATVFVNHGDNCAGFADDLRADGFDASAPELGQTIEL